MTRKKKDIELSSQFTTTTKEVSPFSVWFSSTSPFISSIDLFLYLIDFSVAELLRNDNMPGGAKEKTAGT